LPPVNQTSVRILTDMAIEWEAIDETAAQVTRIGLTFLGTAAFCLLSLFSPDSALLDGSEKINLPFAEPASFFGFMLLGPAVLVMLRVYLQIYVEHSDRLERLRQAMPAVRAPTLVLAAAEDVLTPLYLSQEIASAIPDARLVVLPRGNHAVQIEDPVAFNAAVLDFLAQ